MLRNEKAMTMIEIIIALAILSIALVLLLDIFKFNFTLANSAKEENIALYFAQEKIEEAKGMQRQGIDPSRTESQITVGDSLEVKYKVETQVLDLGLMTIKITVDYGQDKIVLETRVASYDGQ